MTPASPRGPASRKRHRIIRAVCALAVLAGSMATAIAADLTAGAEKAQACIACHGPAGISQMAGTPSLAGQHESFLRGQLVHFRAGTRKSPVMLPMAATLSDGDIRELASYFAALPPPPAGSNGAAGPAMLARGQAIAEENRCASCHRLTYAGLQATPRVAYQREDYLLESLRNFKAGMRAGGSASAMADAVAPLEDDQLRALAHFMAHLP
ncbi:c-type cytochrome [soil metagenome]